jgi:hypothetical protein
MVQLYCFHVNKISTTSLYREREEERRCRGGRNGDQRLSSVVNGGGHYHGRYRPGEDGSGGREEEGGDGHFREASGRGREGEPASALAGCRAVTEAEAAAASGAVASCSRGCEASGGPHMPIREGRESRGAAPRP